MQNETNIRILENLYAAFRRGDLAFVMDHIGDNVGEFRVISESSTRAPWHLGGRGNAAPGAYFEALLGTLDFGGLDAYDLAATGDVVYATLKQDLKVKRTGAALPMPLSVHKFTFKAGKIVGWQAWEDTASTALAFANDNIRLVQDIFAAFTKGDIDYVMSTISDAVTDFSVISDSPTAVPWHLNGKGKVGAGQFFQALGSTVEFTKFDPRDYAAVGDHVYVTIDMDMTVRKTGVKISLRDVTHKFAFKAGKCVRWRASEDTALTDRAFR